jgi:hypothetical protein
MPNPQTGVHATSQYMDNSSFDGEFGIHAREVLGYDGSNLQRLNADNLQIYSVTDGGYTYFCFAAPGTDLDDPGWRIFRLDGDGNLIYADADANYDNVASDPTILYYDYTPSVSPSP